MRVGSESACAAPDVQAVRVSGSLAEKARRARVDVRRPDDGGAVEIAGQGAARRIEHDGDVDPSIDGHGHGVRFNDSAGAGSDVRPEPQGGAGAGHPGADAAGPGLPEVEELLPGRVGAQGKPAA